MRCEHLIGYKGELTGTYKTDVGSILNAVLANFEELRGIYYG